MASDVVHTAEIVDAVIAVLTGADGATHTGGLPANWFTDASDNDEIPLATGGLEHGDLADYPAIESIENMCPAILVRGLGPAPIAPAGHKGTTTTSEVVRVVHIRGFDQCRDSDGEREPNMVRARSHYAKTIHKALFNDEHDKLATIAADETRTGVELTCADEAGAQVFDVQWTGWDLGHDISNPNSTEDDANLRRMSSRVWAIACDIEVKIRNG